MAKYHDKTRQHRRWIRTHRIDQSAKAKAERRWFGIRKIERRKIERRQEDQPSEAA